MPAKVNPLHQIISQQLLAPMVELHDIVQKESASHLVTLRLFQEVISGKLDKSMVIVTDEKAVKRPEAPATAKKDKPNAS